MLSGLTIWTLHFSGMYAIGSLEAQTPADDMTAWRTVAIMFSAACLGACLGIAVRALRQGTRTSGRTDGRFGKEIGLLGALGAVVAITWQALPAVVG